MARHAQAPSPLAISAAEWAATITSIILFLINISAFDVFTRAEHIILSTLALATVGVAVMWRHYQCKDIFLHALWAGTLALYGLGSAFL